MSDENSGTGMVQIGEALNVFTHNDVGLIMSLPCESFVYNAPLGKELGRWKVVYELQPLGSLREPMVEIAGHDFWYDEPAPWKVVIGGKVISKRFIMSRATEDYGDEEDEIILEGENLHWMIRDLVLDAVNTSGTEEVGTVDSPNEEEFSDLLQSIQSAFGGEDMSAFERQDISQRALILDLKPKRSRTEAEESATEETEAAKSAIRWDSRYVILSNLTFDGGDMNTGDFIEVPFTCDMSKVGPDGARLIGDMIREEENQLRSVQDRTNEYVNLPVQAQPDSRRIIWVENMTDSAVTLRASEDGQWGNSTTTSDSEDYFTGGQGNKKPRVGK